MVMMTYRVPKSIQAAALLVNVDNDTLKRLMANKDGSLSYTGISRHAGEKVGLYDTVLYAEEYAEMK
jgi:hypothetical protein